MSIRLRNPGEKRRHMAALAIEMGAICCDTCDHQSAAHLFGCRALDAWARTGGRPYPCHNLELWTARPNIQ